MTTLPHGRARTVLGAPGPELHASSTGGNLDISVRAGAIRNPVLPRNSSDWVRRTI
jgi:hypothetical protein